jgi:hypothetical protein
MSGVAAVALLAAIVWASSASSVLAGIRYIADDRWGVVTLIDVYAGALLVATWMWICERRLVTWVPWVIALLCLGHLVSLVYLFARTIRAFTLHQVFAPTRDAPPRSEISNGN